MGRRKASKRGPIASSEPSNERTSVGLPAPARYSNTSFERGAQESPWAAELEQFGQTPEERARHVAVAGTANPYLTVDLYEPLLGTYVKCALWNGWLHLRPLVGPRSATTDRPESAPDILGTSPRIPVTPPPALPGSTTLPWDVRVLNKVLAEPAIGARSVFHLMLGRKSKSTWQWPARLSWLDSESNVAVQSVRLKWPARELLSFSQVSRDTKHVELLVSVVGVRATLATVLTSRADCHAAHVIAVDYLEELDGFSELFHALLSEVGASGGSIVRATSAEDFAQRINSLLEHISHGEPFDVALCAAFPPGAGSIHILSKDLITVSGITTVAARLGNRLRELPTAHPVPIDSQILARSDLGKVPSVDDSGRPPASWLVERLSFQRPPPIVGLANALPQPPNPSRRVGQVSYLRESDGATLLKNIALAEQQARAELPELPPRWLCGALTTTAGETVHGHMIRGETYRLAVRIAAAQDGTMPLATNSIDVESLDWNASDSYTLKIIFAELHQLAEPLVGEIELPRLQASSVHVFEFSPRQVGKFRARLSVLHRNRLLQSSIIEGRVEEFDTNPVSSTEPPLVPVPEMLVPSAGRVMETRRYYDACLIFNHSVLGEPSLTLAVAGRARITSLTKLDSQLAAMSALMSELATKSKEHTRKLVSTINGKWLSRLAVHGRFLYRNLVEDYLTTPLGQSLASSKYLQVITATPDALVPVEFVYEYPVPSKEAKVCPNAQQALVDGQCPGSCVPMVADGPHVCPMGFWGMRKVIERHCFDPTIPCSALVSADEKLAARKPLDLNGRALLAVSNHVSPGAKSKLEQSISLDWGDRLHVANKWSEWLTIAEKSVPVLYVILGHSKGRDADSELEIGGETERLVGIYDKAYVYPSPNGASKPVVFLLGCDPGKVAERDSYASYVQAFRKNSAAVLSTVSEFVFGDDAASVAADLAKAFVGVIKALPDEVEGKAKQSGVGHRLGEVVLSAKRTAVSGGQLLGLTLVAYGDADWVIVGSKLQEASV